MDAFEIRQDTSDTPSRIEAKVTLHSNRCIRLIRLTLSRFLSSSLRNFWSLQDASSSSVTLHFLTSLDFSLSLNLP